MGRPAGDDGLATLRAVPPPGGSPRVLHVNDAASTTAQLLAEAHRRGLPWRYLPLAASGRTWHGARGRAAKAVAGARWLPRLLVGAARADLLHVHVGSVVQHTRFAPRRYVLHLHGTDVRSQQYDPRWTAVIRGGMARAEAVLFSTPDLAEHVLPHRPDAELFPVPLDLASLPRWAPAERPTVVFASRWEEVKGLEQQLATAAGLRAALPDSVRLLGLDWGPGAPRAARAGVELLPRASRSDYLRLLASASAVVGQSSGMLAASELEAIGIGVPVAAALEPRWYDGEPPAVLVGPSATAGSARVQEVVDAVVAAVTDPAGASAALGGPAWLAAHHDVRTGVDRLERLYERLLGRPSA